MALSDLLLLCIIGHGASACCPDTWIPFQGSCYLFSHQHTMSFVETEHYCRQHNAHMVNVGSDQENRFLKDTLRGMKDENRWIGLTDELVDGSWRWYDTNDVATFFDWGPGEPGGGTREDCTAMSSLFHDTLDDYKWADFACDRLLEAICEKSADGQTSEIVG